MYDDDCTEAEYLETCGWEVYEDEYEDDICYDWGN